MESAGKRKLLKKCSKYQALNIIRGQEKRIKKKCKPHKRKKKKLSTRERKPPIRFLNSVIIYAVYGDIYLFDSLIPEEFLDKGLFSMYNYSKHILEINIRKVDRYITIIMKDSMNVNINRNWKLLTERLRSLSDVHAKELSEYIEKYCTDIEAITVASKPSGSSFVDRELDPSDYLNEIDRHIEYVQDKMSNDFSSKPLLNWIIIKDLKTGKIKLVSFQLNEILLSLIGYSLDSFAFEVMRSGIPEIINPHQYFSFWAQSPMFFNYSKYNKTDPSTNIDLLRRNGRLIPCEIRPLPPISQDFGSISIQTFFAYIALDISLYQFNIYQKQFTEGLTKPQMSSNSSCTQEAKMYRLFSENFHDFFYKKEGLIPDNYREENRGKVCGFKRII